MPYPSLVRTSIQTMQLFLRSNDFYNGICSGGSNAGGSYEGITLLSRPDGDYQVSGHCRHVGFWKPVVGVIAKKTKIDDVRLLYDREEGEGVWWIPPVLVHT